MATPQLSPGVLIREVDLTVGRAENVLDNIGAIAGPFKIGPVDEVTDIQTSQQFIDTFGKPLSSDRQYEYWMAASSFLSYGGVLKVVRASNTALNNANAGVGIASTTTLQIYNTDDYEGNHTTATDFTYSAKNPGTWADSMKICTIDDLADQTIGITTDNPSSAGIVIGYGVTQSIDDTVSVGIGTTALFKGHIKGIITGVSTDATDSRSTFDVKILSTVSYASTETNISYAEGDAARQFSVSATKKISFVNNSGINTGGGGAAGVAYASQTAVDWYDQQTLGLTNSTVYWKAVAGKPKTSNFVSERQGKNDTMHIVVVDDTGSITGIQGNILEKHTFLSKAKDASADGETGKKTYYKDYLVNGSSQIYAGYNPSQGTDAYWLTSPKASGFSADFTKVTTADGLWGQDAQGITFSSLGNKAYSLGGGKDYTNGTSINGMSATLGDLMTGYDKFSNKDDVAVDFLIMGPGFDKETETQGKANKLLAIAGDRKDCVACISPHRSNVVNVTNSTTQTNNLLSFFSPLSSSSYGVFDCGYKYMYDRFNNEFRWIPCNGDIAGLMVRTGINAYPWFSPAGQQRGILNNAIKLAYTPNKAQRDLLYSSRINPIINQKGQGILLFGDKTALGYASAFDRINVRRLFLTVEQALEGAANAQLFELNDVNTRSNFVNIVEPYLRDVQAKRGLYDFLVVCDETNNTPDVIDNNEFRADIYLKPAKSINYVTLTFVATRTGVAFEEVVGTV